MIVYKATNKISGREYVGQTTTTLEKRKAAHLCASRDDNNYFHNALKKYGREEFDWEVLCETNDIEALNRAEQYYIKLYNTFVDSEGSHGYNLSSGGLNYLVSDETRQKMSNIVKKRYGTPGNVHPRKGMFVSEETRKRQSIAQKNRPPVSEETRQKLSNSHSGEKHWNYGRKASEETLKKMRDSHLGISSGPRSDEVKKAIARANRRHVGKPIIIKGIYLFPSMKMASRALGMKYNSFHSRIKRGNVDYKLWK